MPELIDLTAPVHRIAERYVPELMELDPLWATLAGIAGYDDRMADTSPDGFAARAELDRRTIADLRAAAPASVSERVAQQAMLERLSLAVAQYDAGDTTSDINVIASWVQSVRLVFDLMPVDGEDAQRDLAVRMAAVPEAYAGLRHTYLQAAQRGRVAARCCRWHRSGTRSAASGTSWPRAARLVPLSTWMRRTHGAGRSCGGWKPR